MAQANFGYVDVLWTHDMRSFDTAGIVKRHGFTGCRKTPALVMF
jgi:hypothetical protein